MVGFRALDGVALQGRLYGSGELGVVLTHQLGGDATQWDVFARRLAGRGYRALALNVRGICPARGFGCSRGTFSPEEFWRDVGGAVRFLRSHGASRVVLVGASMGGEASMVAAARAPTGVAGVVSLSGSEAFAGPLDPADERRLVRSIDVPKLFVAASGDRPAVDAARHYQALSRQPKRLVIVPSSAHGVALLEDRAVARRVSTSCWRSSRHAGVNAAGAGRRSRESSMTSERRTTWRQGSLP